MPHCCIFYAETWVEFGPYIQEVTEMARFQQTEAEEMTEK